MVGRSRARPARWSLICDDPDAPRGTWSHWVVYNMAPQATALRQGIEPTEELKLEGDLTGRQGKNDFGKIGYGGPCPPSGTHHYFFRLYATRPMLDAGRGCNALDRAPGHRRPHRGRGAADGNLCPLMTD